MKKKLPITILVYLFSGFLYAYSTHTFTTDTQFNSFVRNGVDVAGTGESAVLRLYNKWQSISVDNPPAERYSSAFDSYLSSAILHGGTTGSASGLTDLQIYNINNNRWTQRGPSPSPSGRYGHKIVSIGAGRFLMFGGQKSVDEYFGDTWIYDLNANIWTSTNSPSPPSRAFFGMAYSSTTNKVYLFGGSSATTYYNDLWMYNVGADSWSYITTLTSPTARHYCGFTYNSKNNLFYLFGGRDNNNNLNDLWVYSPSLNEWKKLTESIPTPRYGMGFDYLPSIDRIFLFGGNTGGTGGDETWFFNCKSTSWINVTPADPPEARYNHNLSVFSDYLPICFGGVGATYYNDLQKYLVTSSGSFVSTFIYAPFNTSLKWRTISAPAVLFSSTTLKFQISHSTNSVNWDEYRGANGSTSTFYEYTTTPLDIWSGHNNKPYIRVKGYFGSSEPPSSAKLDILEITYNRTPYPPNLISPLDNSSTNQIKPTFMLNRPNDDDGDISFSYKLQVDDNESFSSPEDQYFASTDSVVSYTPGSSLYEGKWFWHVYAQDESSSAWSNTYSFTIDTTAPAAITQLTAETNPDLNRQIDLSWISPETITNGQFIIVYSSTKSIVTGDDWSNAETEGNKKTGSYTGYPLGSKFETFVSNLMDGTTYYFSVRIYDAAGNISAIPSISPSAYTNAAPVVTLLSPDGGENLSAETTIQWSYSDPNMDDIDRSSFSFEIKVSSDGGNDFNLTIATGTLASLSSGTTSYLWNTRRVANGTEYKIKVTVYDPRGLGGWDISNSTFTIYNANEAPKVTVTYPNGGETLSGIVPINWSINDINLADTHLTRIYISTDGGVNFSLLEAIASPATYYPWNTSVYPNDKYYLIKASTTDNWGLSGEDISNSTFSISNNNLPPNSFNLLSPQNGSNVSSLKIDLTWESNGDPNSGDRIVYTVYYSTNSGFANAIISSTTNNSLSVGAGNISEDKTYYWKVEAEDQLGLKRISNKTFSFYVLNRNKAMSNDNIVYAEVIPNLPDDRYLYIKRVSAQGDPAIESANTDTVNDRSLVNIPSEVYDIAVYDRTQQIQIIESVSVEIKFNITDSDNDGYYDGTNVPVEKIRIVFLDRTKNRWILPEGKQSLDLTKKQVSAVTDHLSVFTITGSDTPNELLSGINIFPNPFSAGNEEVRVWYILTQDSNMTIRIYTLLGDIVYETTFGTTGQPEGWRSEFRWDGRNNENQLVANGMYLCIIFAESAAAKQREARYIAVVK
ncbi:MAG: hypothetical protein COS17_00645 [Elusimicrobia bacterium CG02_land_8_20_14_3_00_37_13]|nr:MAG: hypothetical protein COS17_00645 [Elusimicrobia bacterium CG02_land_8_20_14_3_00_37_13]